MKSAIKVSIRFLLFFLLVYVIGCATMRPLKSKDNYEHSVIKFPERSYGSRCLLENLIFESSFGGTMPPNLAVVGMVEESFVLRSGQLKASFVEGLARFGIRGVVTLSSVDDDTKRLLSEYGIAHREFGFSSRSMTEAGIREATSAIRSLPSPVLVHCHAGADRTGIVIAALRAEEGDRDLKKLMAEMKRYCHVPFRKYGYYPELLGRFITR